MEDNKMHSLFILSTSQIICASIDKLYVNNL